MADLDLSDPRLREMADRNHQPSEVWSIGGDLLSVHCDCCHRSWPCPTRRRLDAIPGTKP